MNNVILVGNLGADPEIVTFENGGKLCKMRLATSRSQKKGDEWEKVTDWHSVICWGKRADTCEKWLKKGSKIGVQGQIITREYETKEGEKRYVTEIQADQIEFLGPKPDVAGSQSGDDDDLPF